MKKFVNPRLAPHVDEADRLRDLRIIGVIARHVVTAIKNVKAPYLAVSSPHSHVTDETRCPVVPLRSSPWRSLLML